MSHSPTKITGYVVRNKTNRWSERAPHNSVH